MSTLTDWINANLTDSWDASIPFLDVFRAYRATLCASDAAQWPKHRVEQELASSIALVGRSDQPKKMLRDYEWRHVAEQRARLAVEQAEADRLAAEQQRVEEELAAVEAAKRAAARAEAARIEADRKAAIDALAYRVAELKLPDIERYIEHSPGHSISYAELAERLVRSLDDIRVAAEWYDDRYISDHGLLDHCWTPHMLCSDGRVKDQWWLQDDGTMMPLQSPGNTMIYSRDDSRNVPDPIRDGYYKMQDEYLGRPRPPRRNVE